MDGTASEENGDTKNKFCMVIVKKMIVKQQLEVKDTYGRDLHLMECRCMKSAVGGTLVMVGLLFDICFQTPRLPKNFLFTLINFPC